MSPDLRAYVQVKTVWQEVPMKPIEEPQAAFSRSRVNRPIAICSTRGCETTPSSCPTICMSAFPDTMLVSPSSTPSDDVFERKDNYYVYLKPFDVADEAVLKRMRFSGKPPVWIPMPPH